MARTVERFKEPKIVRAKRGWFIALYFRWPETHPEKKGPYKKFEISAGLNRIHDLGRREREMQALLAELKKLLKGGFDPFFEDAEKSFVGEIEEKKERNSRNQVGGNRPAPGNSFRKPIYGHRQTLGNSAPHSRRLDAGRGHKAIP
ncbi:hypothetical protein SAMN05660226_02002 [Parapedobacter luteus]|uniref:Uncharacterized protein n=1 Tax=Parapedobacter luteus TaxID=623280 RepID=A0A1T5CAM0_9SPHI|nr:hypothetical protein [Parapedobacter luteus]SKB56386.1 hypothetical protein SAMN05660226_02002 [Parapedobacter luteus]